MKCGIWMCNTKWVATRGKEEEGEMGADCPRVLTPSDPLQEIITGRAWSPGARADPDLLHLSSGDVEQVDSHICRWTC